VILDNGQRTVCACDVNGHDAGGRRCTFHVRDVRGAPLMYEV